jgi:hypothetical protein|tara:strand:+ start:484 stop:807 length:324 start_codon:yes stop_codon:yes gene_type:complete
MASIIKTSINLDQIDKSKIYVGKKGKYLPVTITLNDELDNFGNNGPIIIEQTKEEREAKSPKTYLGNVKVVWTNGNNVAVPPRDDAQGNGGFQAAGQPQKVEDDLPF